MREPWLKFYPTDWRSDPALKMCSLAARGLWIEMIALMHEAVPYGHLLVSSRSPTGAQLAVLAGAPSDQISELIGELESAGVFSRTKEGVIYSRKMTRIAKKSAIARKNGKNGGNPSLCKQTENSALVNQNPTDRDKPQKLEARSQKEKEELRSSKKKGCRIPDGFMPDIAWAKAQGLPEQSALLEAEKFRNYWQAKTGAGATKLDWPATWRTWVLNSLERRGIDRVDASRAATEDVWQTRLSRARAMQTWPTDEFGPKPGREGCQVPSRLLQPGDGEGWGEWKRSAA